MRVDEPRPIIPRFDSENHEIAVYINEEYWPQFKRLRQIIEYFQTAISVDIGIDLQQLADRLFALSLFDSGPVAVRLSLIAIAIYTVMARIFVTGYQVVSSPGYPQSYPIVFGGSYEIEPVG